MVQRVSSPVFIGRSGELERVAELRRISAATGEGSIVLVAGETGIGKTRLAAEIAGSAAADGWTVLGGSCDEFGAEVRPFAALQDMIPAIQTFPEDNCPGELERSAWKAIERLSGPAVASGAASGSVFQLCQDLLRRMAAIRPLSAQAGRGKNPYPDFIALRTRILNRFSGPGDRCRRKPVEERIPTQTPSRFEPV